MLGYQLQTLSHSAYTHYIMCIFSYSTLCVCSEPLLDITLCVCVWSVFTPCMRLSREMAASGDVIAIGCRGLHTCGWSGRAALGDLLGFSRWSSSAPGLQPASSPLDPPLECWRTVSVAAARIRLVGGFWISRQHLNFKASCGCSLLLGECIFMYVMLLPPRACFY